MPFTNIQLRRDTASNWTANNHIGGSYDQDWLRFRSTMMALHGRLGNAPDS